MEVLFYEPSEIYRTWAVEQGWFGFCSFLELLKGFWYSNNKGCQENEAIMVKIVNNEFSRSRENWNSRSILWLALYSYTTLDKNMYQGESILLKALLSCFKDMDNSRELEKDLMVFFD